MSNGRIKLVLTEEADNFIKGLPYAAAKKIDSNIKRIMQGERNAELFKKLDGTDIWEFRTLFNKIKYRLFAFWGTRGNTLVIVTHGIVKKTQKTPAKEIAKAERIRQEYFNEKSKKK